MNGVMEGKVRVGAAPELMGVSERHGSGDCWQHTGGMELLPWFTGTKEGSR